MSDFNEPVCLKSWKELGEYQDEGWVYRGQADVSWGLKTSLERACEKWGLPSNKIKKAEEYIIREFKRRLHHYTAQLPNKDAHIEWLSVMQHYGAPTRLLDFSYSIYVAAYFALEKATKDCLIWAIDGRWAVKKVKQKLKPKAMKDAFYAPINERYESVLGKHLLTKEKKQYVYPINPYKLDERLTIQKGVFMCLGDVTKTFEENLKKMSGYKQKVKKTLIPNSIRMETLRKLYDMNVSRASLFPGLDGFASSLSILPPILLMEGSM